LQMVLEWCWSCPLEQVSFLKKYLLTIIRSRRVKTILIMLNRLRTRNYSFFKINFRTQYEIQKIKAASPGEILSGYV
jgi:hypothetical protein